METNKSYCPVPWKGVNVRNNGDFRVCCHANTSSHKGILRKPDGTAFHAARDELQAARNSPLLQEIRSAMLAGKRHETCLRCNSEDDAGVNSRRAYETEFWNNESFTLEQASALTSQDGSISTENVPVGYYDLRFGNLCNLKCRMCGPADSSFWHKEYFETMGKGFQETSGRVALENVHGRVRVQGTNPYDWHESPHFWEQIEANLDGVKQMHTVGGEPLLIERHYELLRRLVNSGKAKDVIVDYNSNITVVPQKALALWKEFKEVRIGASIDGYGKINEYIRHPSKWETTENNLDLLDQAEGNFNVWITTTVQIYNIFYLTDFLRWKIERNFRRVNKNPSYPFVNAHPLHNPKHFHIAALPASVKEMVVRKFERFYTQWFLPYTMDSALSELEKKNNLEAMRALLGGYTNMMRQQDLSEHLPEFWRVTASMDRYRGENFFETMPEIAYPISDALKAKGFSAQ